MVQSRLLFSYCTISRNISSCSSSLPPTNGWMLQCLALMVSKSMVLGSANAGSWCHKATHKMIIWSCNFIDQDPLMMVHTTNTSGSGLLLTNKDYDPLPILLLLFGGKIGGVDSALRPNLYFETNNSLSQHNIRSCCPCNSLIGDYNPGWPGTTR